MHHHNNNSPLRIGRRMARFFISWILMNVVALLSMLLRAAVQNRNPEYYLPVVALANAVALTGGVWYYLRLLRLRRAGEIVFARVSRGSVNTIWLHYRHNDRAYDPFVGTIVDVDSAIRDTLLNALKSDLPVRIVVDPLSPSKYTILAEEETPEPHAGLFGDGDSPSSDGRM